jgi:hypothetical protein
VESLSFPKIYYSMPINMKDHVILVGHVARSRGEFNVSWQENLSEKAIEKT